MPTLWKEDRKAWNRERLHRYRSEAIARYGGECIRCGFSDPRALQFDHITGEGLYQRRSNRLNGGNAVTHLRHLLTQVTSGLYQLLCANCNWIKRHDHNEVRHTKKGK